MATNFEPNECVIFIQSTKISTHENKAIHSNSICVLFQKEASLEVEESIAEVRLGLVNVRVIYTLETGQREG